jgi:hypothetical protein
MARRWCSRRFQWLRHAFADGGYARPFYNRANMAQFILNDSIVTPSINVRFCCRPKTRRSDSTGRDFCCSSTPVVCTRFVS